MGSPVRIVDLARELIARNGLVPDADVQIRFTGVRPGEKLYEELACDDEQTRPTAHEKIRVWQLPPADPREVGRGLELLAEAMEGTAQDAVAALMRCVPEYRPARPGAAALPALRLVAGDVAGNTADGADAPDMTDAGASVEAA
jgi:FlaA1/EpsC-like NDP-sugar epimerase